MRHIVVLFSCGAASLLEQSYIERVLSQTLAQDRINSLTKYRQIKGLEFYHEELWIQEEAEADVKGMAQALSRAVDDEDEIAYRLRYLDRMNSGFDFYSGTRNAIRRQMRMDEREDRQRQGARTSLWSDCVGSCFGNPVRKVAFDPKNRLSYFSEYAVSPPVWVNMLTLARIESALAQAMSHAIMSSVARSHGLYKKDDVQIKFKARICTQLLAKVAFDIIHRQGGSVALVNSLVHMMYCNFVWSKRGGSDEYRGEKALAFSLLVEHHLQNSGADALAAKLGEFRVWIGDPLKLVR